MPKVGLIVNDGKPLAVETAKLIQERLETGGHSVVRASSSGGMVGFANPDQHLRMLGYNACVPEGFDPSMALAIVLGGDLPPTPILIIALLYSIGAHGIMTLNDFKSVEGDLQMGIRSLPAQLGRERAAKVACVFMLLPQLVVIALLLQWQLAPYAAAVSAVVVAQCLAMKRLLSDPKQLAPWYNATGVSLYVLGMMSAAVGLGGWFA